MFVQSVGFTLLDVKARCWGICLMEESDNAWRCGSRAMAYKNINFSVADRSDRWADIFDSIVVENHRSCKSLRFATRMYSALLCVIDCTSITTKTRFFVRDNQQILLWSYVGLINVWVLWSSFITRLRSKKKYRVLCWFKKKAFHVGENLVTVFLVRWDYGIDDKNWSLDTVMTATAANENVPRQKRF